VVADAAALGVTRPRFAQLGHQLASPHDWIEQAGVDAALAAVTGAAFWLVGAWLGLGLLTALVGRLPGAVGQVAWLVSVALVPNTLRRLAAGSAGLGVLLAPVAAAATPARPTPGPGATASAGALPVPAWPVGHAVDAGATGSPHDSPRTALRPRPSSSSGPATPVWPSEPAPVPPRTSPVGSTQAPHARDVRVQTGDSLWLIAARRLGAGAMPGQIADAWPRWYAVNKDVVGDDPSLILPGQVLRAPAGSAANAGEASA
jgi:hypothetical protein